MIIEGDRNNNIHLFIESSADSKPELLNSGHGGIGASENSPFSTNVGSSINIGGKLFNN